MRRFIRGTGAVVRMAIRWGAIGLMAGGVLMLLNLPQLLGSDPKLGVLLFYAVYVGLIAAVSGVVFGILVEIAERGRALADLTFSRAVLWGAIAGATLPLLAWLETAVQDPQTSHLGFVGGAIKTGAIGAAVAAGLVVRARGQRSELASRAAVPGDRFA